jgi:hypothetical protein
MGILHDQIREIGGFGLLFSHDPGSQKKSNVMNHGEVTLKERLSLELVATVHMGG